MGEEDANISLINYSGGMEVRHNNLSPEGWRIHRQSNNRGR
jgi:hypothetical protein